MSTEFHVRVQTVLDQALAAWPSQREAAIRAACAGDEQLLHETLTLLPHYLDAGARDPDRPATLELRLPGATTLLALRREAQLNSTDETLPTPPFSIDQYMVLNGLGAGGMGVVYRAVQSKTGREVAIKIMRRRLRNVEEQQRFVFEGEVLRQLQHPCIARFRHSGIATLRPSINGRRVIDERPYFVMEYIHGLPVTWYADRHRLDVVDRLDLLIRVCEAMEYAHYRGIVHCDLKPDNILVDAGGTPKLVDFGIARFTGWEHSGATMRERAAGTPAYASPEQVRSKVEQIGPASDVFTLGIIAHELLTGRRPERRGFDVEVNLCGLCAPAGAAPGDERVLAYYLQGVLATAFRQTPGPGYRTAGELAAALTAVKTQATACRRSLLRTLCAEPLKAVSRAVTSTLQSPLQAVLRTRIRREAEASYANERRAAKHPTHGR